MIRHFFLDKTNSIIEESLQNIGLNPVLHVEYGNKIMRGLIHFDVEQIKELIDDKTFANTDSLKFTLKMTNYFSIDNLPYEKALLSAGGVNTQRAASFDLMLFKLPYAFDEGRGFDFLSDFWVRDNKSYSEEGSNWYFCKNGITWDADINKVNLNDENLSWAEVKHNLSNLVGGVYTIDKLIEEYEKYENGEESIIVGTQHFDFGDENLCIDITNYVNECISSGVNNGLCLAFTPKYEVISRDDNQYVGFVTDHTNTFFHPFVEADYSEYIDDDRASFINGHSNSVYLYTFEDEKPINLDSIPSCSINGTEGTVKQVTKGVYEAEFGASACSMEDYSIVTDKWSNIALNGASEDDIELDITVLPKSKKYSLGSATNNKLILVPSVYGINDDEKVNRHEEREVTVEFVHKYESDKVEAINSAKYRLYIKDGNREYDVIPFTPIEKGFLTNFFMIYTEDLIPNEYYVDIEACIGREKRNFKNVLHFTIVSDVTERYQ